MSQSLHSHRTGLVVGSLLGFGHLVWSVLVALGLAQWLLNFVFQLHMIKPPLTVGPFSVGMAVGLILVTFVLGYGIGYALALIWNAVHKNTK